MKLPKAFFTSRVTEALGSLAVHVTSARNVAASLKPIKTAALDLEEEEEPRPIIFRVHLDQSTSIGVNWLIVGVIAVAAAIFWRKLGRNGRSDSKKNRPTEESSFGKVIQ
jgi:hypothetical protein